MRRADVTKWIPGVWKAVGIDDQGRPADEFFWLSVDTADWPVFKLSGGSVSGGKYLGVEDFKIEAGKIQAAPEYGEERGGILMWKIEFDQIYDDGAKTRWAWL
eukprot:SAG31_NODE_988_length_10542_cov_52.848319_4_plen_103_part_00